MDLTDLHNQMKLSKNAVVEINKQNRIFERTIQQAIKGAPEQDKKEIEKIRLLTIKALNLAKQGKIEESQQLIKDFQNGRQNSK